MATFQERSITVPLKIRLTGGGARANLFEVDITFPASVGPDKVRD